MLPTLIVMAADEDEWNVQDHILHQCVRQGERQGAEWALQHGANVNAMLNGTIPLLIAINRNDRRMIHLLVIDYEANVCLANAEDDTTPLMAAAALDTDSPILIQRLIEQGAAVNVVAAKGNGASALAIAAVHGHGAAVQVLLSHNASVHLRDKNGATPLMLAVFAGHIEVVKQLIQYGANVRTPLTSGLTAVMMAAAGQHAHVVKLVVDRGASVDGTVRAGNVLDKPTACSALMFAIERGFEAMADTLIALGADVNLACPSNGFTALMAAARSGKENLVKRLLQAGVDVNAFATYPFASTQLTALMMALEEEYVHVAEILLNHGGIDYSLCVDANDEHYTVLGMAIEHGYDAIVAQMMAQGAPYGYYELIVAAEAGHEEIVILLLEHGVQVNPSREFLLEDSSSQQVRQYSSSSKDIPNVYVYTPLMAAVANDHENLVKIFLNHGADIHLQDSNGMTAAIIAKRHGFDQIHQLLEAHAGRDVGRQT